MGFVRLLPCLVLLICPSAAEPSTARAQAADPWTLHRALAAAPQLEVNVPSGLFDSGRAARALAEWAARVEANGSWRVVLPAADGATVDPRAPRIVLATAEAPLAAPLLEALEVTPVEGGFRHAGHDWNTAGDVVAFTFEDPARAGRPVTLLLANEPAALASGLERLEPRWRPGWTGWRGGELRASGPLFASGRALPSPTRTTDWTWELRNADSERVEFPGLWFEVPARAGGARARTASYGPRASIACAVLANWATPGENGSEVVDPGALGFPPVPVVVHRDPAEMQRLTGAQDLGLAPAGASRVHVLLHLNLPDDGGAAPATWLARRVLGPPAEGWMADAAGVAAAGTWWGRPLDQWAARLAAAGLVPPLAELVDAALDPGRSPHVHRPLRALLFELCRERAGDLVAFWSAGPDYEDEELVAAWDARLAAASASWDAERESVALATRSRALAAPLRRGAAWVRTSRNPETAYGSEPAARSLIELRELGANAVALRVAYTLEPGLQPEHPPTQPGALRASETDVELATGIADARAAGMRVMLAPQLLTRPWGTLAGARVMAHEEECARIFDGLDRAVLHAALLAELTGCEVLSIGEDLPPLSQTSLIPDAEPAVAAIQALKLRRWAGLVARARRAFGGCLTYGAHWSGDRPVFADGLEFSGASLFRPLGHAARGRPLPTDALGMLRKGLRLQMLPQGRPPLLVTAVGFPSTEHAWRQPFSPTGALDVAYQAELYRLLTQLLKRELERGADLAGFYLWYWSTDPTAGGLGDRGFTPRGKPAEELLEELFSLGR